MTLNLTPTDFNKEVDDTQFRKKITGLVDEILRERHSEHEKQKPYPREERYNFACPYCGDSSKDATKKRANIYYKGYGFHCYNCKTHTSIEKFLSDFGKALDSSETIYARNVHSESVSKFVTSEKSVDISYFIDPTILEKYAIPKAAIFKHWNLTEIDAPENGWIRKYLKDRHQTNNNVFGWDKKLTRLFIFNLTLEGKVLGFQVRNFKTEPKYVTHTLEMIYKKMEIAIPTDKLFEESSKLSFIFGISTTDFSEMITITEGPLDSFLIRNAMSACGLENEFPFDISNKRYMYDYDSAGTSKALEKIKEGESVFLWKKYIADIGINIYKNKLDYTDVVTIAKSTKINLLPINGFFSDSKYDAFYI
ncbi:MAG: hypothetical protein WC979_01480 [Candidatus Pacearchaeota archaeon]|jgi:hypothetical protein|nr:hypothetical protein [Clostridia bacterium]